MPLQRARQQDRHRVIAEIGREIGDPEAVVVVALAAPHRRGRGRKLVGGEGLGADQVRLRRCADREKNENGIAARLPASTADARRQRRVFGPVAAMQHRVMKTAMA